MHEIHFESIDSTSTYAKTYGNAFPSDQITCITADEQTAGHGRFNRPWASPKGVNIYASFYFRLPQNTKHLTSLAQVMTSSMAAVLTHLNPKIKWPNDIQLNGKKVCGVLCELTFQGEEVIAILGVGVNVNMEMSDLQKIDKPATSLKAVTGHTWDQAELLKKLQKQFENDLEKFKKEGFDPFHDFFERSLCYKGEEIRCFDGKKEWVGTYHSLNEDGGLNIRLPDQTIHTIYTASE